MFRPSATKSGRPYGVTSASLSCRTPPPFLGSLRHYIVTRWYHDNNNDTYMTPKDSPSWKWPGGGPKVWGHPHPKIRVQVFPDISTLATLSGCHSEISFWIYYLFILPFDIQKILSSATTGSLPFACFSFCCPVHK